MADEVTTRDDPEDEVEGDLDARLSRSVAAALRAAGFSPEA